MVVMVGWRWYGGGGGGDGVGDHVRNCKLTIGELDRDEEIAGKIGVSRP